MDRVLAAYSAQQSPHPPSPAQRATGKLHTKASRRAMALRAIFASIILQNLLAYLLRGALEKDLVNYNYSTTRTNSTIDNLEGDSTGNEDSNSTYNKFYISAKFGRDDKFEADLNQARVNVLGHPSHTFAEEQLFTYSHFPDFILNDSSWSEHLKFLENPKHPSHRGGGYWFWKGPLIRHHLKALDMGDFVVYADADLSNHLDWMDRLMDTMVDRRANLALYQMQYKQREYVKRDVWDHFCGTDVDPSLDETLSYAFGLVVLRKTPATVQFVDRWVEESKKIHLIDDGESRRPNIPEFKAHRNDQSIGNLLLECVYRETDQQSFEGTSKSQFESKDKGNPNTRTWNVKTFRLEELAQ